MITGFSKLEDMDDLIKTLESEILELDFAIHDVQDGDEIEPNYFLELRARKEILEQLLNRLN